MGQHSGTHWAAHVWLRFVCWWLLLLPRPLQGQGGDLCDTTEELDSGGDNCSYYDENPKVCGCCNTASFRAEEHCCSCRCDTTKELDTYGDGCSWYNSFRHRCGDYDTPAFLAKRDCCACQEGWIPPSIHDLLTWPRKATKLILPDYAIQGELPKDFGQRWPNLTQINLRWNKLRGPIPAGLGNVSKLVELHLDNNQFSGTIPGELGKLPKLQVLNLHENDLSGPIPTELAGLLELKELNLGSNVFRGSIPMELGGLPKLQFLDLSSNTLSGHIPVELAGLSELVALILYRNQLKGTIPPELGGLRKLEKLNLDDNQLSGPIPAELAGLSKLRYLQLHYNRLTGSIPPMLGNMSKLWWMFLGQNQLVGHIPPELAGLSSLTLLYLNGNQLSGPIPPELGGLTRFIYLHLDGNQLSGPIPPELGRLSELQRLGLGDNQLSGSVPAQLGGLSELEHLSLGNNQLTGPIPPELGGLQKLRRLLLAGNQLRGSIPAELGGLLKLRKLNLGNNQLRGSIPAELRGLSELQELYLKNNELNASIPAELGELKKLSILDLGNNELSGSMPAELGDLLALNELRLNGNRLNGSLPPELGGLNQLQHLSLADNELSGGIPLGFRGLSKLENFDASGNAQFCGPTEVLSELPRLRELRLRRCCFRDIFSLQKVSKTLTLLDLGENQLAEVPESLRRRELPQLQTLLLDHNRIRSWDTSTAITWDQRGSCAAFSRNPRLAWPQLERLDISSNSLEVLAYDFLASLVHLRRLKVLEAAENNLSGHLPNSTSALVLNRPNSWDWDCSDLPTTLNTSFPALETLDLSNNDITAVLSPPPQRLSQAYLAGNRLTESGLGAIWWRGDAGNALQLLNVAGNPELRLPIRLDPAATSCPPVPSSSSLMANPQGWNSAGTDGECTSLCPGLPPRILHDLSVRQEVLCRCTTGQGAGGLQCTVCPNDTYSVQTFDSGTGGYVRRCHGCPADSILRGLEGQCFAECSCLAGFFMQKVSRGQATDLASTTCRGLLEEAEVQAELHGNVSLEGQCDSCGMWRSSRPGSRSETECLCNSDESAGGWKGLFQEGTACRCPDGQRIDFVRRSCVPCAVAEDCSDWTKGREPPRVKAGFWSLPPPPPGSDGTYGNFSSHEIWRCDSSEACPGNFSCGWNRTGVACSLCRQGFFRTPSGRCTRCPQGYTDTRLTLLGVLVASMVLPLMSHGMLSVDASARGVLMTLRSFRVSLKQLVKFMQVLGVVSLFQVQWPKMVLEVFQIFRSFNFDIASWAGVACLDQQQQQSAALEVTFRWLLPVAAAAVTVAAAATASSCGLLSGLRHRKTRLGRLLTFGSWDILRVLLFGLQLFYPSLLKNALLPLTCSPSPHGHITMNMFPHIICWDSQHGASFWPLAVPGIIFTLVLVVGYTLLLVWVQRTVDARRCRSEEDAALAWWSFLLEGFRPDCTRYALVLLGKDIALNLVPVALPGWGTAQLLVTAIISTGYAVQCFHAKPYDDVSNTLLEASTSFAVAWLCVFSAGMGFQSEPEVLDISSYIKDGSENPAYIQRAITLVTLQGLSLVAPAVIITYQVMAAFERTRRFIPRALLPTTELEREQWLEEFHAVPSAVDQLDDVALQIVRRAIQSSRKARTLLQKSQVPQITPEIDTAPESEESEQENQHSAGRQAVAAEGEEITDEPRVDSPAAGESEDTGVPRADTIGKVSL